MKRITPMKAIRVKCMDCMGGMQQEVKACPSLDCPLWKFRLGKHPFTEKNQQNPFLQPKYFVGREEIMSGKLIKLIQQDFNNEHTQ